MTPSTANKTLLTAGLGLLVSAVTACGAHTPASSEINGLVGAYRITVKPVSGKAQVAPGIVINSMDLVLECKTSDGSGILSKYYTKNVPVRYSQTEGTFSIATEEKMTLAFAFILSDLKKCGVRLVVEGLVGSRKAWGDEDLAGSSFDMNEDAIAKFPQTVNTDLAKALELITISSTDSGTRLVFNRGN